MDSCWGSGWFLVVLVGSGGFGFYKKTMNKVNISQIILISFLGTHKEPVRAHQEITGIA